MRCHAVQHTPALAEYILKGTVKIAHGATADATARAVTEATLKKVATKTVGKAAAKFTLQNPLMKAAASSGINTVLALVSGII